MCSNKTIKLIDSLRESIINGDVQIEYVEEHKEIGYDLFDNFGYTGFESLKISFINIKKII